MLTTEQINQLLDIKESYQASDKLKKILFDKEKREKLFLEFLELEKDVSYDWFHIYFQDEHADRRKHMQDFTPNAVSDVISRLTGESSNTLDIAAGTGGMTIRKWNHDRMQENPFTYLPSEHFYQCEELSDRAIPFLLFNLMIRGMNATVVHGDALSREVKQIYFIQNERDDHLLFSSLNVFPHNETVKKEFGVYKWLEDEMKHIESVEMPAHLPKFEEARLV